ncbi:MAG: ATP synthase F1 subunit gamma [Draconibacterium sp.]|nr:MAG: ATP synthase F1 subunit gamma [Draconibacterium sp.]
MAGLKEIRNRITSVKTTRQVTSAMKMVSAAKLKKAQDAIIRIRPYADKLHEILVPLGESLENVDGSVFTEQRDPDNVLIILISSNRGLCGGFNINISKKAVELVNTKYAQQQQLGKVDVICIGKQGMRQAKYRGLKITRSVNELFDDISFENVSALAAEIMENFAEGKYDRIELVYNHFRNAAVQVQSTEQFLPVEIKPDDKSEAAVAPDFIFEPSQEAIVNELIPRSLKIQLYKAILDSHAAEHGARMTAMHQATDNATDLIQSLTLDYNKARQAAITGEILEIVSGAEALKG